MHGSLWDRLNGLLNREWSARTSSPLTPVPIRQQECDSLDRTNTQPPLPLSESEQLRRLLGPPPSVDPSPGFYARVLQCIEERAKDSIWAVFIYSPFRKRLVFASMALAILLGTAVVSEESADGHLAEEQLAIQQDAAFHNHMPVIGSQSEQRDAVLVNFATYEEPVQ